MATIRSVYNDLVLMVLFFGLFAAVGSANVCFARARVEGQVHTWRDSGVAAGSEEE